MMDGGTITRDFLIPPGQLVTPIQNIFYEVTRAYRVSIAEMKGPRRFAPFVRAREEFAYRLSNELGLSLQAIGMHLGNRDHTSVLHYVRRYEARNPDLNGPKAVANTPTPGQ